MKSKQQHPLKLIALLALAALCVLATAAPAPAEPEDPFNPSLAAEASTHAAGEYPQLTLTLGKPANHCKVVEKVDFDTTECHEFTPAGADNMYEEQDFKRLTATLPEGLSPDLNAVRRAAPEECVFDPTSDADGFFSCPADAKVGSVKGKESNCLPNYPWDTYYGCGRTDEAAQVDLFVGDLFMLEPEPGEQGHLVAILSLDNPDTPKVDLPNLERVDTSITVDQHGRVTATTDNLPDVSIGQYDPDYPIAIQVHELRITFEGGLGAERGHPLLTNATACSKRSFGGEAQGYSYNVASNEQSESLPGHGDGKTVAISADYPVVGCNSIPYDPKLTMSLDPPTPGAVPAITSTITQAKGEQNSDSVAVKFPKGFKINIATKAGQCADDQFASGACPAESAIGTATAHSALLPTDSGPLSGTVYLGPTDLASGNLKLMMNLNNDFLPNGIELTGTSQLNADGTLQANFTDVPDLPISSFTLALEGGDKGLVRNPKTCGLRAGEATFTSHQGKQVVASPQVGIACDEASLDVGIGTRRTRAHPTISLTASAASMKALSFRIPSGIDVKTRPAVGKGYGTLTFVTEDGITETKLDLLRTSRKRGSILFSAVEGKEQVTSLALRHKKAHTVAIANLPEGTLSATLELVGKKNNLLTNPSTCRRFERAARGKRKATGKRRDLNYAATVTNIEGKTMTPVRRNSMACGKLKAKKRR